MKNIVKRYIPVVVSIVLLITAFIVSINPQLVTVGKGEGTNAKISDLNEVTDLLTSLSAVRGTSAYSEIYKKGDSSKRYAFYSEEDKKAKYESFTIEYDTSEKIYNDRGYVKIEEKTKAYITDGSAYYSAKGYGETRITADNTVQSEKLEYDINLYYDATQFIIRINKFSQEVNGESENLFDKAYYGKFLKFTFNGTNPFYSATRQLNKNFETLNYCGRFIGDNKECFSQDGNVYRLKGEYEGKFFGGLWDRLGANNTFIVNLSDAEKPVFYFTATSNQELYSNSGSNNNYVVNIVQTISLSNIDNTVVKIDEKAEIQEVSPQEILANRYR